MAIATRFPTSISALLALCLVASPAHAAYCDAFAGSGEPRHPDGPCDWLHSAPIHWGAGTSELSLLVEGEARGSLPAMRRAELKVVIDEVANAAGPAFARLTGVRLPEKVHVVVVNDPLPEPGSYAETFGRPDGTDCPIIIFGSGIGISGGRLARTLAHELFHCAQFLNWPGQKAAAGSRWWSESSAEWFEDFALPGRLSDSDLLSHIKHFRERAGIYSLLDGQYANVVLFAWLGERRIPDFIASMALGSEAQLDGAARAMDAADWQRFAQDYIDERITTPSHVTIAGADFVPRLETLHTTTGRPGADPAWVAERAAQPLTLMSGKIEFVPGQYAPSGQFGQRRAVFSERVGNWSEMPSPLRVDCLSSKQIRFAGLALTGAKLRVDPGTRAGNPPDCACPLGVWTIPEDGLKQFAPHPEAVLLNHGEVTMRFNRDGTARFVARDLVFELPERRIKSGGSFKIQISRTYAGSWRWSAEGDRIATTATDLLHITERTTSSIRGSAPLDGTRSEPPRESTVESDEHDGLLKQFSCDGDRLTITEPLNPIGMFRQRAPSMKLTRYPRSGIFVRQ